MLLIISLTIVSGVLGGLMDNNDEDYNIISNSITRFTAKTYQELKDSENILFCPLSLQMVMALVQSGAQASTADEMAAVLELPMDKMQTQNGYRALNRALFGQKSSNGVTTVAVAVAAANRVYVDNKFQIAAEFRAVAESDVFSADVQQLALSEPDETAAQINRWVADRTDQQITHLVDREDFTEDTKLVLVNTLYLNASWMYPFRTTNTVPMPFYIDALRGTITEVPMMQQKHLFDYAENVELDARFLSMPFAPDGAYRMVIVLPNTRDADTLAKLEARLPQVLGPQQYQNRFVQVTMPSFHMESTIYFHQILQKMGMRKVFSDGADLSGLGVWAHNQNQFGQHLKIDSLIQKNVMNVTEAGTIAASATAAIAVIPLSLPPEEPVALPFTVDHPFLFLLKYKSLVLFVGKHSQPS